MSLYTFLQRLSETAFSMWLRGSTWAEPVIESIHVLTLTVFLGFTVLLDLRLMGVSMRERRASQVLAQLNPWVKASFAVMIVSGTLLFTGDPASFYSTIFFKIKMIMLLLALANILVFNWTAGRTIAEWDQARDTPRGAKAAAIISLVLWVAIIAAGRAIAYVLPPP
jgi:uncharacterized membrane protein